MSHVSLGAEIWPLWQGAGNLFVGWGPVLSVRDPTDTKCSDTNQIDKVLIFFFVAASKNVFFVKNRASFLPFRPLVHPTGAVRTEKT